MTTFKELEQLWKNQDTLSKILIFSILMLVFFAYLPTLQFDYVTQDQWRAFRYLEGGQSSFERLKQCTSMIPSFYVQTGRPLVWPTECLEHAFVSTISDFQFLRPFSLIIVLFTVIYLSYILEKFTKNLTVAFIIGAMFVMAPAYSFMYLQGLPAFMVLVSVIFALASYKYFSELNTWKIKPYSKAIKALVLFLLACMIYPAFAFIVLILALLRFTTEETVDFFTRIKHLIFSVLFYTISSVIYYLFVKLSVYILTLANNGILPSLGAYEVSAQFSLTLLFRKICELIEYFYMMPPLNFVTMQGINFIILLIFSCIIGVCRWRCAREKKLFSVSITSISIVFITCCVVLLVSISPWLFSKMDSLATRHILPFSLFICFSFIWIVFYILNILINNNKIMITMLVLFILFPIAMIQNKNSFLEIVVTRVEIELMRAKIKELANEKNLQDQKFILVILPKKFRPLGIENLVNMSKYGNDNMVLSASQNPVSIPWMLNAILKEILITKKFHLVDCGSDTAICVGNALKNKNNIVISYTNEEFIQSPIHPYMINLSDLTSRPINPNINIIEVPEVFVSSILDNFDASGLLSSNQPGWHAQKNPSYPQTLTVDFKGYKQFEKIGFLPQDGHLERMPKNITIEISIDSNTWIEIASTPDLCSLKAQDGWYQKQLISSTQARYLRINIFSNCGNSDLLTLRGFKVE